MIVDEFIQIASLALRQRSGVETLRVKAVRPSMRGPEILYEHGPIGPPPATSTGAAPPRPTGEEVLECVARMLRIRWQHGTPKAIAPADDAWRLAIERDHPGMFEAGGPHSWSGWRFLWRVGAEWIDEVGRPHEWETAQTKEKFGAARWYVGGKMKPKHQAIIRCIEIVSGYTCEYCGAPGLIRKGSWAKVTCSTHSEGREAFRHDDD